MPASDLVKLYMGSSMADLNKLSEYRSEMSTSVKRHISTSDKVFSAANEAVEKKDEERAYVLFMRYIDIVQKVRKSKDFKKDEQHFSLLLGTKKLMDALDQAEVLSTSLRNRYELIDATKAAKKIEKARTNSETKNADSIKKKDSIKEFKPEEDKSVLAKDRKFITCKELYDVMFSKNRDVSYKVLIMDIRQQEEFEESTIKYDRCISVPKTHIKPGTVSRNIEKGIWDASHVNQWINRSSVDLIVLLDWKCSTSRMNDQSDPIKSLTDALFKWEQSIFLKRSPVILEGGYCEWLEFFPQFTTNSKVARPEEDKKPDTSVNSLLNFTFGESKKEETKEIEVEEEVLLEDNQEKEEITSENTKPEPLQDGDTSVTTQLPSPLQAMPSSEPVLPSSGLYPTVPTDLNLQFKTKQNTNGPTSAMTATTKKQIPTVNRATKPEMPSRNLKPKTSDSSEPVENVSTSNWPPSEFKSSNETTIAKTPESKDTVDIGSLYMEEMKMMRRKMEENERITQEIENKKKEAERQQELEAMKKEMEESERKKKQAEKDFADMQRQKTKPKPESASIKSTASSSSNITITKPIVTSQASVGVTTQPTIVASQSKPDVSRASKPSTSSSVTPPVKMTSAVVKPVVVEKKPSIESNVKPTPPKDSLTSNVVNTSVQPPINTASNKPSVVTPPQEKSTNHIETPVVKNVPNPALNKPANIPAPSPTAPKTLIKPKEPVQTKPKDVTQMTPAVRKTSASETSQIQRRQSAGLPINWEKRLDPKTGRYFYLDHKTKSTYWQIPEDVVRGSVKRVPLKEEPKAPSSSSLKRSHSTPNIAKALEEENQTPNVPSRNEKPRFHEYESPDVLNARIASLNPVFGGAGKGLCGLRNLGNTCYMNSILQCMFNTVQIIKYFLNGDYKEDINRENFLGSGGEITDGFAVLLQTVWSGRYSQITPRNFRQTIAKLNHIFESYQQQDSQELLLFLMDGLHEDLNEIKHREYVEDKDNSKLPDTQAATNAWVKHKKLNKSIIVELFQGQFRARTQCLTCHTESRKFDIFMYLSLPLPSKSCSLMDAIGKFSEPEYLTGDNKWHCPKCKVPRNANRIIEIWKLPPVLFIHFKRFSFYQRYADKMSTNVNFPHQNLDLSPAVKGQQTKKFYNLYAVSHHHGNTLDSGHYIATCKNAINGNWYKFDDEAVSKTSAPSGPTAYMLCYTSFPHKMELQSK